MAKPGVFPLSYNQRALWFLYRMSPRSAAYNLSFVTRIVDPPPPEVLQAHIDTLSMRHDALRTSFSDLDGQPRQEVHPELPLIMEVHDAHGWDPARVTAYLSDAANRPFNLSEGPLWRVVLLTGLPDGAHVLLCAHHIVSDFQSLLFFFRDLGNLCAGESPKPQAASYHDYVAWQQKAMDGEEGRELRDWWRGHLADFSGVLELPTDKPRPAFQTHHGLSYPFQLDATRTKALKALARQHGVTLNVVMLACYQALLHRLSGSDDICVGTPTAGRDKAEWRRELGYFVNPLLQRARFEHNPTFAQLFRQVHESGRRLLRRRTLPFELLVRELQPERDPARSPLFQTMFTLLDAPGERLAGAFALGRENAKAQLGALQLEALPLQHRTAQFDVTLFLARNSGELNGSFDYNTDLFEDATIAAWAERYTAILDAALADADARPADWDLLGPEQRDRLAAWNQTDRPFAAEQCIHERIAEQAEIHHNQPALVFENQVLTYSDMRRKARAVVAHLQHLGVQPGDVVAVCIERSVTMVTAMLGVLECGAAYLPLDPSHPPERLCAVTADAGVRAILHDRPAGVRFADARAPKIDPTQIPETGNPTPVAMNSDYPAYVIYTSGSTGKPKGVVVSHRNALNFFAAMEAGLNPDKTLQIWSAVTNLSFDISVLELLWTLSRGCKVVIQATRNGALHGPAGAMAHAAEPMDFGLFFFADSTLDGDDKYRLLMDGARFADDHGFNSVWTPERHFHSFGGLYPNPAVSGAAVAALTRNVGIRAGSVVLPLNDPIRVTEEWSLVDNLSGGRAGISIASGWNADDFVLSPENYEDNKGVMLRDLETIRTLWRGESIRRENGQGDWVDVTVYPKPIQKELPVWMTAAGSPETFRIAGELGLNLLTHLLGQHVDELAGKIRIYKDAWRNAGHRGEPYVTLMLHTFVGDDADAVRDTVRAPFRNYLDRSFGLMKGLARELGLDTDSPDFADEHREMLLDHAFNRFFESSALFGTPETCLAMVDRLKGIGVDEIGCLIDFGVPLESALEGLRRLNALRELSNAGMPDDHGFAAQVERYQVRSLQCTPSMMRLLLADPRARRAMGDIETILMGGEALPESLLTELRGVTRAEIFNMYGPTETTVWSSVDTVTQPPVTIGTPVANTSMQILDRNGRLRPIGSPGELHIGGEGVTRGYLNRPRLTAERFIPDPFNGFGARLYRTGDLAAWRKDGRIDFLGRIDHQVKLRGYRIELGEIEAALTLQASINSAAVLIRGTRLVAFATGNPGDHADLRNVLLQQLPAYMVPADFIELDAMPLTSAGKIDRKALARLETKATTADTPVVAPQNEEEEQIAAIWQEVLEVETVSIHQSFFEMGGHSLLLARAHARLQALFGDDLTMITLFRYPTIHGLAEFIRSRGERTAAPPPAKRRHKRRNSVALDEPIAVIGLACRFPGAENEAAFWQNLAEGKEAVTFLTDEQLRDAGIDAATLENPNYVKAASMLEGAETFDAAFFGFTPREAQLLDPQHRVFLELAWHALENAGYDPGTTPDRVGVFAGAGMNTYLLNNLIPNRARLNADNFQVMVTNDKDFLPTRTAYKLGLKGPAISIQTGCSTSLVAVDQACENLRTGKCEMALAGGVAVRSPQAEGYPYQEGMIASPDGHTRTFDVDGSGTLFGSGAGVVVLKPLKAALADGDHIQAVLRGSAVNNDGTDKISYTAPGIEGQATVIGEAMRRAGVQARDIDYVEAHGTGTELGDPIELAALNQAWRQNGGTHEAVALGSVKSNMGHLDTAAGIAGLIKVILSLKNGLLPPSLHFKEPNPKIDFGPFQVNDTARPWPRSERPRLAGVSSFGIGGTNAHAIVAEAPEPKPSETQRHHFLLPVSAQNQKALDQLTHQLADFIEAQQNLSPADIAYTLQMGRAALTHRRIATASGSDAADALRLSLETPTYRTLTNPDVIFLLPGGGTQYPNMGRALYDSEPVYRDVIDKCAEMLRAHLDLDIRDLLYPEPGTEAAAAETMSAARNQPAIIFTAGYAMAQLCLSWNILPKALMGHSNGEYTAACLAGVLSLEDALAMTAYRGLIFEEAGAGGMSAVETAEETLLPFLTPDLTVAAVNGPSRCTASGPAHSIDALETRLTEAGIDFRRLSIPMAGHSSLLDPVMGRFRDFVAQRNLQAPELPYISCETGAWISAEEATSPDYWVRQMRRTVRFSDGFTLLASNPHRIFLEMGPGQALTSLVRRHPAFDDEAHAAVGAMHHPHDERTDAEAALEALGQLWLSGYRVDWRAYHYGEQRYRVPLPGYPFQRKRYWVDAVPMTTQTSMELTEADTFEVDEIQEDGPLSETERRLVAIWREVLGLGRIGVNDHFFMLGGDSLLVTRVHARLGQVFDSAPPIKELFEHPILAALARRIDQGVDGVVLDAIPRISREAVLPLSFSQQRLWFLDQLEGAGATYNMKESLHMAGPIATVALERALDTLIQRHETLRTGFPAENGKPRQQILDTWETAVTTIDLSTLPADQRDEAAAQIGNREALRPYDLTRAPLIRLTLLRLAAEEHLLVVTKHHIISDGWSIGVAIRDLTALYEAYRNDQPDPLPPLPIQYADYAGWQIERMDSLGDQQAWWVEYLTGAPALLELPTDRPRPPIQSFSGAKAYFNLDGDLLEKLTQLGRARDATLFMVLHAGFALLLSRYSGQHDICVGTPVAGRNRAELEPLIGFFVNSLVLRTDLSSRLGFHELLAHVREESLGAFSNQDLPFDRLVEVLQPERSLSHTPLFQVMFILQNADMALRDLPEVSLESKPVAHDTAMFDLTLFIEEKNNRLECAFEYNTDLFDASTMERMAVCYRTLLEAAVAHPEVPVDTLALLSAEERAEILSTGNQTDVPLDEQTTWDLIAARAVANGDATALQQDELLWTYRELAARARALAAALQARGVKRSNTVGIYAERVPELLPGLLACMIAGAAYVPLDPAFPADRLAFMARDANLAAMLTLRHPAESSPAPDVPAVYLDAPHAPAEPGPVATPVDTAYILYTSGSTGKPKGVAVGHRPLRNFLQTMAQRPGLSAADRLLAVTTISFDIAGLECYLPLITGACIVLATRKDAADGARLLELIERHRITVMQATPATWKLILAAGWQRSPGFTALCGGEAMPADLARELIARADRVWNLYGPTETTIWSAVRELDPAGVGNREGNEPIGKAVANTRIYILDRNLEPLPIGVPGELYIGGEGLAQGYRNRSQLTAQTFIPCPFSGSGQRLYRTGDLARLLPSGDVAFLGRIDHQVKIRGFRIELGEIEAVLNEAAEVDRSVVVAREMAAGDVQLAGYVTVHPDADASGESQVTEWAQVWSDAYAAEDIGDDPTLNLSGWNNSYDGQPIPRPAMRHWVETTVDRVLAEKPQSVLEIGCGTGMLLFRIAPHCTHYTGVDISTTGLDYIRDHLSGAGLDESRVSLRHAPAHNPGPLDDVDTVILNSVIQYFPDAAYLETVLQNLIESMSPDGRIFVGDVRAHHLLDHFHASILDFRNPKLSVDDFSRRLREQVRGETELLVDPAFFPALQHRLRGIADVRFQLKRGEDVNELTRFRYDVILDLGEAPANHAPLPTEDWHGATLNDLRTRLNRGDTDNLLLRDIPNARLTIVNTLLNEPVVEDEAVNPETLYALAESCGYQMDLSFSEGSRTGAMDAWLRRDPTLTRAMSVPTEWTPNRWTNNPAQGRLLKQLTPKLQRLLSARLPDYMVPAHLMVLEAMPLTANGKLDRKALPHPGLATVQTAYVAPHNETEQQVAAIFQDVLNLPRVGRTHGFFELGGHSLSATQVIARLQENFGVAPALGVIFARPTVAGLASVIETLVETDVYAAPDEAMTEDEEEFAF